MFYGCAHAPLGEWVTYVYAEALGQPWVYLFEIGPFPGLGSTHRLGWWPGSPPGSACLLPVTSTGIQEYVITQPFKKGKKALGFFWGSKSCL